MRHDARNTPGYVAAFAFPVAPWTVINVSAWTCREAAEWWSAKRGHVNAVRLAYRWADEVWSAEWHLHWVSPSAHTWRDAPEALRALVQAHLVCQPDSRERLLRPDGSLAGEVVALR